MRRALVGLVALALSAVASVAGTTYQILSFGDLVGWRDDNQQAALAVFARSCRQMKAPAWREVCAPAKRQGNARAFFEKMFRPVLIGGGTKALFTGYFEPEIAGSLTRTARYRYPIYRKPPGALRQTRAEIEEHGLLRGRGLEVAWLEDPVEAFFLQVQGSGRIRLASGRTVRVGYGGTNGRKYRSIGKELVRRGALPAGKVSAAAIRVWVHQHAEAGRLLLQHNPAFIFFRRVTGIRAHDGPLGAMNLPITPLRTIAVDRAYVPLGAPVWIEKEGRAPMHRLMVAQDVGSAIKGPQRADIFYGTGKSAGRAASRVRDSGRMVVLMPTGLARQLVSGG